MNCKSTAEMLSAYLDRELGPAERDAIRTHLANCDRCRAEERDLRALKSLLLGVRAPEPADDFEQRLMRRLREEDTSPASRWFDFPRLKVIAFGQWGGLVAAGALAVVVLSHSSQETSFVQPIVRSHTTVARNVDFDVYAQHDEAYERADDYTSGAPLLMPTDAP